MTLTKEKKPHASLGTGLPLKLVLHLSVLGLLDRKIGLHSSLSSVQPLIFSVRFLEPTLVCKGINIFSLCFWILFSVIPRSKLGDGAVP